MVKLCDLEKNFIETYIVRDRRRRLQHELGSKEKRKNGIWRFGHCTPEMVIQKYAQKVEIFEGKFKLPDGKFLDCVGNVHVIIADVNYDQKVFSFAEAMHELLGCGPYILLDCDSKFALIETEPDVTNHEHFLLRRS